MGKWETQPMRGIGWGLKTRKHSSGSFVVDNTCLKIILMSTASNPFEIWTISSLSFNSLPRISFISFSLGNGICITFIRCSNSRGIDNTFPNIITCVDLQLRTICFIALIEHLLLLHYNPFIIVNLPLSYKNIF